MPSCRQAGTRTTPAKVEFSHHSKKRVHPAGHLCGRRFPKSLMSRGKKYITMSSSNPQANITFVNYATNEIQILQAGGVMGTVPAAPDDSNPVSETITVSPNIEISIQGNVSQSWYAVCNVPANKVVDGITVSNNVIWGVNAQCNISPA
jgi:hypothetical protein